MFLRKHQSVIGLLYLCLMVACSRPATGPAAQATPSPPTIKPKTSVNFVSVRISNVQVAAGGSGEATVSVEVQDGYHVNANPATDPWLKPTEVIAQAGDGLTVGYVKYPTAIKKKFGFSDKELSVYEGEVGVKVLLKAEKTIAKGPHKVSAKLNIQACDNEVCYAPGTLELSIPVIVN
ncbi:MAG TPA: protein-disulfide reductase DsbD domain-containing protein [Pyrinomonadaceae bacterium]|nr:protein-disulfide reductase DsbD domain-containing protein [Pyrinomonadaceae bacterium]